MLSFNIGFKSPKSTFPSHRSQSHGFTCETFGAFTNDDWGQHSEAHGNYPKITLQEALDIIGEAGGSRNLVVRFEDGSCAGATLTDNGIELDVETTKKMLDPELHSELMAYGALQTAMAQ